MIQKVKIAIGVAASALLITGVALFYHVTTETEPKTTEAPESIMESSDDISKTTTNKNERDEQEMIAQYHKISAEEAYDMMNEADSFILLDVRTNEEYQEKHINDAVLIPDYELLERAETDLPDKNALIFVYCRSGRRSANSAIELANMGYTNVYDFGGIIDWPY